jgi:hypothetical protein
MGLSEEERRQLEALTKKSKEPDAPPVSKSIQARIDFGDPAQVEAAIEHGFLTRKEAKELKEEAEKDGDEGDEKPKRRGYFGDD